MAYGKSTLTNPEIARLELEPLAKETHDMLRHTQRQLRRVANHCASSFLLYHDRMNTLLRMDANLPVCACPPELCARWLKECQALCPDVHSATVLAVTNWLAQTYTSQKSPKVNEKQWRQVLRRDAQLWSYREPLPIRLWNGNAKMSHVGEKVAIVVRVDRFLEAGKKVGSSTPLTLTVRRPTRGADSAPHQQAYNAACEIADGKRKLAQSQLVFDRGKWFLQLTISGPEPVAHAKRDPHAVIVVRPGRMAALRIHANCIVGDFGEEALDRVSAIRRKLDERWASLTPDIRHEKRIKDHLSRKWQDQCGAVCNALAAEFVRSMKKRRYGKVLWLDGNNRTAALALACRSGEDDDRELFPFHRLRLAIKKRCSEIGMEVVERGNFRAPKRRNAERRKRLAVKAV